MLIKYIKRVLWRAAKRLSYIQDARCLKVNSKKALSPRVFKFVDSVQRTAPVGSVLLDGEARRNDELCLLVIMSKDADVISF